MLAITLTQAQLDAANRLHAHLRQWRVTDGALTALTCAFLAWEPEAALLKVAAVNQLYGMNLYAAMRMAEHVSIVMATTQDAADLAALGVI